MAEFESLRGQYAAQWKSMAVLPQYHDAVAEIATKLASHKTRYQSVERKIGVPWYMVAVIHERESGADFTAHLHNGDPLTARTYHVPAGRPKAGSPPFSWEDSAIDALTMRGLDQIKEWPIERVLCECEEYNGEGYRKHSVPSAYVWSFTNVYKGGKYVADGVWSSSTWDKQCGVAPLLSLLTSSSSAAHHDDAPAAPTENVLQPDRILAAALAHGAPWDRDPGHCHLFYLEGCNLDGTPNDNAIDLWNDVRGVLKFVDGKPQVVFKCKATTEPGIYYDRVHVIGGAQGAALIDFGYQECWQVDIHHAGKPGAHEALCQTGAMCRVYRDFDKSFRRQDGHITTGWYGINHHSTGPGYHANPVSVGPWSAGCLVAEDYQDHLAWMRLVKSDSRYLGDHNYVFGVIVMPAAWIAEVKIAPVPYAQQPKPSPPPALAPASRSTRRLWRSFFDQLVKWRT